MTRPRKDTYLLDPENVAEMARLEQQGRLLTQSLGGILPELENRMPADIKKILDLGCGPGEWVREIATAFPDIQVTGLDISVNMVTYAKAMAKEKKLRNAHFVCGNLLEGLQFPDGRFGLVNGRALGVVLKGPSWEPTMREWLRITRPGGMLRVTELRDDVWSNKPSYNKMNMWFVHVSRKLGYGFDLGPDGVNLFPGLMALLKQVGWQNVQDRCIMLDVSFGTPYHVSVVRNCQVAYRQLWPVFQALGLSLQEIKETYDAMLGEINSPDFQSRHPFFILSATKPLEPHKPEAI